MKVRIGGLFSGIGAHVSACDRLNIPGVEFEHVFQSDVDPRAVRAFDLMHGPTPNLGDVRNIEGLNGSLEVDILFWSPCCQDISLANPAPKGNAEDSGTRSSLAFEIPRILEQTSPEYRPYALVMEEVPTMIRKYHANFEAILSRLSALGYQHLYGVLSATDYGVAQTRKRAYCVSLLGEALSKFPDKISLTKCLADYLEDDVPDKYYLSQERINGLILSNHKEREAGRGFECVPQDGSIPAHTLTCKCGGGAKTETYIMNESNSVKLWLESGNKCVLDKCIQVGTLDGKGFDCIKRVYSASACCPTIPTAAGGGHLPKILIEPIKVRKLTPREAFRLMGFTDEEFNALQGEFSDTQLYRFAGNSVVVEVYAAILMQILKERQIT